MNVTGEVREREYLLDCISFLSYFFPSVQCHLWTRIPAKSSEMYHWDLHVSGGWQWLQCSDSTNWHPGKAPLSKSVIDLGHYDAKTSQELSQNRSPFIGKYVGRGNSRLTKLFWIYLCVTFWISFFDVVLLSSLFFWIVCRFWFWFWIVCRFLILILPRWWRLTLCAGFLELRFFFF